MSNLGPAYEDDENYSPHRANAKGILRDKGTAIVALATTKQLGAVCPTDTSGGLIKNVLYIVDYDTNFNRIQFIPVFHAHLHGSEDSDEDGGSYLHIRQRNIDQFAEVNVTYLTDDTQTLWTTVATGGVITFENSGGDFWHQLDTLGTTGNHITATLPGIKFEWGTELWLQFQSGLDENSNILARAGIGIDNINDSPSTSRRQMAVEACDGHGTNWVLLNANGNSGSLEVTPTTIGLLSDKRTIMLEHSPATFARIYNNGIFNAESSTNVADDSSTDMDRLFKWGVKLPTGTDNIQFRFYFLKIIGNHKSNN